jgi:hypothetical protein
MTKNDGPKKLARDLAKKLNIPLSEAKQHLTRQAAPSAFGTAVLPAPITLKVHPEHQGYLWARTKDAHAIIEGRPGSGKSRLARSIATQAQALGETIIFAEVDHDGRQTVSTEGPRLGAADPDDVQDWEVAGNHTAARAQFPEARSDEEAGLLAQFWTLSARIHRSRPVGRVMVILDGFTGFSDDVIDAYLRLISDGEDRGVTLVAVHHSAEEPLRGMLASRSTLRVHTGFERNINRHDWERLSGPVAYRAVRDEMRPTPHALMVSSASRGRQKPIGVEQFRFDGKRTGWHVRGHAKDGRYTLVTCKQFENVLYSVIDWEENVRGAMNVIGGGLGIDTAHGEDPAVDEALEMLEDSFEVSHRNRVPLVVSGRRVAGIWHALAEEPAVAAV